MKQSEFSRYLDEREDAVQSPQDLSEFVALLEEAYRNGYWEKQDLVDYLGGIEGVTEAIDGLCMNYGYEYPHQPTWAWFARILRIAFAHS